MQADEAQADERGGGSDGNSNPTGRKCFHVTSKKDVDGAAEIATHLHRLNEHVRILVASSLHPARGG